MATWNVPWLITIEADSPRAAAEEALRIQRDPSSDAIVFDVAPWDAHAEPACNGETVDLLDATAGDRRLSHSPPVTAG